MSTAAAPAPIYGANTYHGARRWSAKGIVGVVAAHVGVLGLLVSLDISPLPLPPPLATLMVQIIAPTRSAPPAITPAQPVERKAVLRPAPQLQPQPQPQTLAAQTEAPSATATAISAAEVPLVTQAPAPPAEPAPAFAPAAPTTLTQARFDADYLQNPAPAYPVLSRRLGEEGKVVLRVFVESTGRPSQIEVRTGSGSPRLDQAAQEAVWRWKFVPARRGLDAVGAWVLVPIVFNLRG